MVHSIHPRTIQEVKEKADIVDVISEHIVLKKKGKEFVGICPFHDDTHLSCSINLDKGVWICFAGCGQGSLKTFIWKLSGKSFDEIEEELEDKTWELDFSFSEEINLEEVKVEKEQYKKEEYKE